MSLQEKLRGVKFLRWVKTVDDSFSFRPQKVYPIIRVEGDNDLIVVDETEEEIYVEQEDLQYFVPVSDEEFRNSRRNQQHQIIPQHIHTQSNVVVTQPRNQPNQPSVEMLDLEQLPYWTQYVTINNEGVWVTTDAPDEVSKLKEKLTLETPIVIKVPKRKIPMEVLANMFKDGKITYAEFEEEMKKIVGGVL